MINADDSGLATEADKSQLQQLSLVVLHTIISI